MRILSLVFLFLTAASLFAEPITAPEQKYEMGFHGGAWEGTVGGVACFSPFGATRTRPTINYAAGTFSFGRMLTDIKEWGMARGNLELVGETFGGGVFAGRGNYLAGFTLWSRYNFVQPGWRLVPYAQVGAGAVLTDIDQRQVGQLFNFNLGIATGLRYFLRPDLSVNAEYRFQHVSNANLGESNIGVNAQGAWLGVSCFF